MKTEKKMERGFTLMELVITIAIVIVLSVISFPIYRNKTIDAKIAEGYALLGVIVDKQRDYYNEYAKFWNSYQSNITKGWNDGTCMEPVLGINAINNRYFTYFCVDGDLGVNVEHLKWSFKAKVYSKNAGNLSLIYNLTKRYEIGRF